MAATLSVILPVFNSAHCIRENIENLILFLRDNGKSFEVIAVNDGSTDTTSEILLSLSFPELKVILLKQNQGKFAAIRAGMLASSGECCIFTDADLPYQLEAIPYMYTLVINNGFHVVAGDRRLPESLRGEGAFSVRRLSSYVFSFFVRLSLTGEVYDTQCGLKAFRGDIARMLFEMLHDRGFSGDVEVIYLALKYNLAIRRIPVRTYKVGPSTVRLLRDVLPMIWNILQLPMRWRRGVYENQKLRALASQCYWS